MWRNNQRGLSVAGAVALLSVTLGALSPSPARAGTIATQRVLIVLRGRCPDAPAAFAARRRVSCPAQDAVRRQLAADGGRVLAATSLLDTLTAELPAGTARALGADPQVAEVLSDSPVQVGALTGDGRADRRGGTAGYRAATRTPRRRPVPAHNPGVSAIDQGAGPPGQQLCGTEQAPLVAPEAVQLVNAPQAQALGYDGAGVTVAVLSDGLDPKDADLQRNAAYGRAGAPVVTQYQDFSGDGTAAPTDGQEAFGDVSSIAAQGNEAYNLSQYVNPAQAARLPAGGCWAKVVGAAPGADVMVLKVLPQDHELTISGILQAIQYAVAHGAKVINESFGFPNFPDSSLDVIRDADDAAVAAGVTVVVASGDGGGANTIGAPATDPEVISVGATTSFQAYAQTDQGGFYNPAVGNGQWADDNIASFSSGGFSQSGSTVDLVAPGDGNWALCSTDTTVYSGCADTLGGTDVGIQFFGGTSEAAPLTAAAAADVIQAYAQAHGGADPSPALTKDILTSTAVDTGAPADEQGAGLLNVAGAVALARDLPGPGGGMPGGPPATQASPPGSSPPNPGVLVSPGQVNVAGPPGAQRQERISLTNPGPAPVQVNLSTRALTDRVYTTGARTFTMDPQNPTTNTGTFPIWDGLTEVYQSETFDVPPGPAARLVLNADYPDSGQTSQLHIALFEPDGTYAAYSDPQGLADHAEVEVAAPPPGRWTALFFTQQNSPTVNGSGTSGAVQWDAAVWGYAPAGTVSPASVTVPPGQTVTASLTLTTPATAGDSAEAVVVSSPTGQTTVPVTVRSDIRVSEAGGTFNGVLTGGNGRPGVEAQSNSYFFDVPPSRPELDVSIALATNPDVPLVAYLVRPDGQTAAYSSNFTLVRSGQSLAAGSTRHLTLYDARPRAGQWALLLEWVGPVAGNELSEPFTGAISFKPVRVTTDVPDSGATVLPPHHTTTFKLTVHNDGPAPEAIFVDPRSSGQGLLRLQNVNSAVKTKGFTLPLSPGLSFPLYIVPPGTSQVRATLTRTAGSQAVSFDMSYYPGDPDISPAEAQSGSAGRSNGASATASLTSAQLSPGMWVVNPDEVGPYPPAGAPKVGARLQVSALTRRFDPDMTASTQDFWRLGTAFSRFLYLRPGQQGTVAVRATPTAPLGTVVRGTLYIDSFVMASFISTLPPGADVLASVPYSYRVGRTPEVSRGRR